MSSAPNPRNASASVVRKKVLNVLHEKIGKEQFAEKLADQLLRGAENSCEYDPKDSGSAEKWFDQRFLYPLVWLEVEDYARALVRALWLAPRFAPTDFGGARQRDFAQLWTDTARGFLGEIAFQRFMKKKLRCRVKLDVSRGELERYLASDVKVWDEETRQYRQPKLKTSIKTTKFNGRWLELPGAQFDHSDVFVAVKVGISRLHFSAFLKDIRFLKDKLFPLARKCGELNEAQEKELLGEMPEFQPLPAYTAGYIEKQGLSLPIHEIDCRRRGRKPPRITVFSGVGLFSLSNLRQHQKVAQLDPKKSLPIEVYPIKKSLTEAKSFLANTGRLHFGEKDWKDFNSRL